MTDDTAKAILDSKAETDTTFKFPLTAWQDEEDSQGRSCQSRGELSRPFADLKQMARLWLMKRELTSALHFIIDTTPDGSTVKNNATEWLAKITAIAGESNDGKRD